MPSPSEPVRPDPTRPDRNRVLDSVLPVALFIGLERAWGLAAGVAGATLWSIKVVLGRRRRGEEVGRYLPILVGYLAVRAIVGIATDSDADEAPTGDQLDERRSLFAEVSHHHHYTEVRRIADRVPESVLWLGAAAARDAFTV